MSNDKSNNPSGINLPFEMDRDKLALLVGGMAVIALIFATYNFFNKSADITSTSTSNQDTVELKDKFGLDDETKTEDKTTISGSTTNGTVIGPAWVANDYVEGDITGGTYSVVRGDTLWEIAEAVYGNGAEWTKILEANKETIKYLPNGTQALIVPGQVLVLP